MTTKQDFVTNKRLDQAVDAILDGMQAMFDQARKESREMFDQARKERKKGFDKAKIERENNLKQTNKRLKNLEEEVCDLKSEIRSMPDRREFNELKDKVRMLTA